MSYPISRCNLVKAVESNDFSELRREMEFNIRCGHFSFFPCEHDPPCRKLTEKEMDKIRKEVPGFSKADSWITFIRESKSNSDPR